MISSIDPDTVWSPTSAVHHCLVSRVEGSTARAERNAKLPFLLLLLFLRAPWNSHLCTRPSECWAFSLPIDFLRGGNAL
jgi:hypothetical protein